jgi:hypothetical protein
MRILALLVIATGSGCLGFDPTPPPAARLSFSLDLPGDVPAGVEVYDEGDQLVGSCTAAGDTQTELALLPSRDYGTVRLVARAGERLLKGLAVSVEKGKTAELGRVDSGSTALAQLIQEKVAGQGGSFSSIPASSIATLGDQVRKGGPEIKAFGDLVKTLLAKAPIAAAGEPVFAPLDASLSDGFVKAHEKELAKTIAADYRNALTAAVGKLEISLICDAALVKVMFTVDASGEALDGNGAPQLLRQPTKSGKVFLAITVDESSPVADAAGLLKSQMTPNDPDTAMFDDGTNGDELAGDGVYTRVLVLPRGMHVKYKYTNGSAGEGWTRTEEWPGNARLLAVKDLLSRNADGSPDCLVIRRDVFGDEASNKNFVNLHSLIKGSGGALSFEKDLGGAPSSKVGEDRFTGGLGLGDARKQPPLSPEGIAEAAENGSCSRCPAPLTLSTDDDVPPELVSAEWISSTRIKVGFSEAMEYSGASSAKSYLLLDASGRAVPIQTVAASSSLATLEVAGADFAQSYTLHVKPLKDASAIGNLLAEDRRTLAIGPDRTPPQIVALSPLPLRDYNPGAKQADPSIGQVLLVSFDEELDRASAENAGNYQIQALSGEPLPVLAAFQKAPDQVWLITGPQGKRKPYNLIASSVRDLHGNPLRSTEPIKWNGFALYKVTFGAVPGFAFLDLKGQKRGIPAGAGLYLTGTVLSVARDLQGNPIGVSGRTDVTGVPEFEMKPGPEVFKGKPIYTITVLAPPGTYAWKVAHGTAGEFKNPPPTLEKVHKSLGTTADATGVNIDPATLTALPLPGADGKPVSFLNYAKAAISKNGLDLPGPFVLKPGETLPAPTIMFKRENPDEVCSVTSTDRSCPAIVVGTWRDLDEFKTGSKTDDYDDGLPEVDPVRNLSDGFAPRLIDLKVRDSESLLLSFDERLAVQPAEVKLAARHAKKGTPLGVSVHTVGSIGSTLLPHQILIKTDKMENGASYTLAFSNLSDALGNLQKSVREQSFVAPQSYQPFTPLADNAPPKVLGVLPKSPTALLVQFDEKISPADGSSAANFSIQAESGTPPSILSAALQGGGTSVLLSTSLQAPEGAYTLVVTNISDLAAPQNVLLEQKIKFKGFGDFTPPKITHVAALSPTEVAVAFSEPLSPLSAPQAASYAIAGLSVVSVGFSGDANRKAAAFDAARATFTENIVVLQTSKMTAGQSYSLAASGVTDLSNNPCKDTLSFKGVGASPKVDVVITYRVSQSDTAAGIIPPRAISTTTLSAQREGVFLLGCTVSVDGATKGAPTDPVNIQLGNFPPEGSPLTGVEPQLLDNGAAPDLKAGDSVFTIRVKDVPLGSSLQWKAFAPYTVSYKNANPGDASAAFADASPGPSVFSDGQEYPGNENAVRILGDKNGDGVVFIHNLFGDEITYKKITNQAPFVWVVDDHTWVP